MDIQQDMLENGMQDMMILKNQKTKVLILLHESRGAHQGPKKPDNRLTKFATHNKNDPYRLSDEKYPPFTKESPEGISYPYDDVTENALKFIGESKDEPFFLYLAHWMVHSPIHTKNRELLQYYCDKLGIDFPTRRYSCYNRRSNKSFFRIYGNNFRLEFRTCGRLTKENRRP